MPSPRGEKWVRQLQQNRVKRAQLERELRQLREKQPKDEVEAAKIQGRIAIIKLEMRKHPLKRKAPKRRRGIWG